jgi:hypothetical protein
VETIGWECQGVVCGKPSPLRLKPPPVLVKDRWVSPREQVLNVLIACWYMSPVSLVACHQQMFGFASTASLVGLGEKLETDTRIGQLACCGLRREPFFSGVVVLINSVDNYVKGCYMWTT